MGYRLGIDFGTTFTAAAVHRDGEQVTELVPLGDNRAAVPSVVFVAPDGGMVMGDAAARRAVTDPDRVIREVKRRIGDETPLLIGGLPIEAHTIAACFVRWVVDRVSEREGARPEGLALTHPASWGRHKCALLTSALVEQGIATVRLVPEPAAAAFAYAASRDVPPGAAVGVYDLGGGTFDAAIVRRLPDGGFVLAGRPEGIESLGGVDFDEAVFAHVRAAVGPQWTGLDFDDPLVRTAAAALRRECTEAKEGLSADTEVTIPVMLPGVSMRVRMVRTELEQLVAPAIAETVEALRRACASADVRAQDLAAVLLAGGSSRIPLVAQRVSAELDRPVTVDADPKSVVASGAALSIAPVVVSPVTSPVPERTVVVPAPSSRWSRRGLAITAGIAACLVAVVATASTVGSDLTDSGTPVGSADTSDLPREVVDRAPVGEPGETDPWTGEPYRETTPPGPRRPGAKPAQTTPESLTPAPTTGGDRADQIAGNPPPTQTAPTTGAPGSESNHDGDIVRSSDTPSQTPPPVGESDPPVVSEEPSVPPPDDPPVDSSTEPPPPPPEDPPGETTGETTGETSETP
ncbi:Hsp70 family protein [Actinophytocola oryzae]|uniref:Hsp70 protein n=1 Tax=Actinophytocola oryzae TaxID=502181 RepID=A0A4V3FSK3_9PSEU|nr:Hsp70 family protein [Actinophytocola oryzae]TDV47791.1 Hsp70 protein [Actinophytocola oryzae]